MRRICPSSFRLSIALLVCAMLFASSTAFTRQKAPPKNAPQQKPPAKPADAAQGLGGVSTGAARTYTSRRTVGITDAKAPVVYEDVTAQTALINFKHQAGGKTKDYILETPSGGVAI